MAQAENLIRRLSWLLLLGSLVRLAVSVAHGDAEGPWWLTAIIGLSITLVVGISYNPSRQG